MSLLDKLFFFVCKQKFGVKFYLSVFGMMLLGFVGSVIVYELGLKKIWAIPLIVAVLYFMLWLVINYIRFHYYVGEDGKLQKRIFIGKTKVYDGFRQTAKKYEWQVKNVIGTADMGFIIRGVEQEVDFEINMLDPTSLNSGATGAYAVYIKTQKGENFEILPSDIVEKSSGSKIKDKLVGENKDSLAWLMKNNKYITKISFYNGLMASLIFDSVNMAQNAKEAISRLVQISKSYAN